MSARDGKADPLLIGIVGVTITGNLGGQAMLEAVRQQFARRFPGSRLRLFSIYPGADAASPLRGEIEIVPSPPLRLVGLDLPYALLACAASAVVGSRLRRAIAWGHLQRIAECDVVVDLSGIAFVEGRGVPLLAYNLACCVPSFAVAVPHYKLAQSLGPFQSGLWRLVSRWALRRCAIVIPRGERSSIHLADLGIPAAPAPDTSFVLEIADAERAAARALLPKRALTGRLAIVAPSRVTRRACAKAGIDYMAALAGCVRGLIERGWHVAIVPHSLGTGPSKNNDIAEAVELSDLVGADAAVTLIDPPADARVLRALFGLSELAVTSRFHATVAALAGAVPPVTISWSFKYKELLGQFGLERLVVPATELSAARLLAEVDRLDIPAERSQLAERLRAVVAAAHRNFDEVEARLHATTPAVLALRQEQSSR